MLPRKKRAGADLRKGAVAVAKNAGHGDVTIGHHPNSGKIERAF